MSRIVHLLLGIIFVAVPGLAVAVVAAQVNATPPELSRVAEIELANVTERIDDGERALVIELELVDGPPILAPAWTGVVQEVTAQPGETISHGETFAVIDGVPRIALHTSQPMYRALRSGDSGSDVQQLHLALAQLGFDVDIESSRYGTSTRTAIRELMKRSGAPQIREFEPAHFIWIPDASVAIRDASLTPGAPAPNAGTVIAQSEASVTATSLTSPTGESLEGEGFELTVTGIDIGPIDNTLRTDQADLILQLFRDDVIEPAAGSDEDVNTTNAKLRFDGSIRLQQPVTLHAVPASAVVGDVDGNQCVTVQHPDGSHTRFATNVVGGGFGWTAIDPAPTAPIIANPLDIEPLLSCTS